MKSRFTTFDIKAIISELRLRLTSLRVVNVYDIDSKTYLIKLAKTDEKAVLLLESGIRLHTTEFEWPKNVMPSGFAMKMRKHLKGRRLEKIEQLGIDRIVDLQFGSSEAAYHVILELYDRGNIILTDHEYMILNIQRPRTDDSQDVRFAVRERYPVELAKQDEGFMTKERLTSVLTAAQDGDNLKKILNPHLVYGGSLIEHCLISVGLNPNCRVGHEFKIHEDIDRLLNSLNLAESIMNDIGQTTCQGYIIQQKEKKPVVAPSSEESEILLTYSEFHSFLFKQHEKQPNIELSSFDKAVDEFFSKVESQKQDKKLMQQEKTALKKLEGIKSDHVKRLDGLKTEQQVDVKKAKLIEMNLKMVDRAITVIRSALASQVNWPEIQQMIEEATQQGDSVATSIKSLKLETNHFTMLLKVPTDSDKDSDDSSVSDDGFDLKPTKIDIDLGLSAYANARKYYNLKRNAAAKEQKTVDATEKAMKSAERKTKQTLKEVRMVATINKARKTFWFEKFLWFISSENYVVIGGRDQQQNELIVKRYLNPGDLYVHADLHGASSVVIKNPSKEAVPPKTLNEAGTMALCYSAAWDAKVITSSWWVYHDQVSKTAPTGEYLTTGSFMIRGKKNYLPPSYLIYGFGFLYKVDESCVFRHKNERRIRTVEDEDVVSSAIDSTNEAELFNDDVCSDDDDAGKAAAADSASSSDDDEGSATTADGKKRTELKRVEEEEKDEDGVVVDVVAGVKANEGEREKGYDDPLNEADEFPNTTIHLHHVKGDEFTLKREDSFSSHIPQTNESDLDRTEAVQDGVVKIARLSAKQRRELKKNNKVCEPPSDEVKEDQQEDQDVCENESNPNEETTTSISSTQQQIKRGQKSKLKKIKDKYGDQDEEERQLRMELLASSRGPKEEKLKKGKKGKQQQQQQKMAQMKNGRQTQETRKHARMSIDDIKVEIPATDIDTVVAVKDDSCNSTAAAAADKTECVDEDDDDGQEGQEEDSSQIIQDADLLNSLTGVPDAEDLLLFCVPICAPYSTLVNYKFKVKLVPGTTKRGKAAKLAVNMFISEKMTSIREKDLLKSLKDTDVSRNMPGKVKVSAPNLHRQKHK